MNYAVNVYWRKNDNFLTYINPIGFYGFVYVFVVDASAENFIWKSTLLLGKNGKIFYVIGFERVWKILLVSALWKVTYRAVQKWKSEAAIQWEMPQKDVFHPNINMQRRTIKVENTPTLINPWTLSS